MRALPRIFGFVLALTVALPEGAGASASGPDELRVGISFGGISLIGGIFEFRWGDRSLELNIGTWTFRDLSVSLVGKQYFGPGDFRPYAGAGLWAVASPVHGPEQQTGVALVARAPIGAEWNLEAGHHFGGDLALNRALWVRRRDPRDETPPTDRLIPLPGFHYRWTR